MDYKNFKETLRDIIESATIKNIAEQAKAAADIENETLPAIEEEVEQIDEVKKKRMLNLTGLPTDKGTISLPNTEQRAGGPGAKPSRKHPGNGLPKSGLLPGQRWSGLLGTQMNDPKKVRPEDRYLRKEEVEKFMRSKLK